MGRIIPEISELTGGGLKAAHLTPVDIGKDREAPSRVAERIHAGADPQTGFCLLVVMPDEGKVAGVGQQ